AVKAADKEGLQAATGQLKAGYDNLSRLQQAITSWTQAGGMLCPRCARHASGPREMTCPACQVHMVIPDTSGTSFPSVTLGPSFARVHAACEAVATGTAPLDALGEALAPLETELGQGDMLLAIGAQKGQLEKLTEEDVAYLRERFRLCLEA